MTDKIRNLLDKFIPYLMIGVSLAFLIIVLLLLAHIVVAGFIIGLMIFAFQMLRERFSNKRQRVHLDEEGHRIIEHDPF